MDLRVVSIGTLATNDLWNEEALVRTGHATTTLVRAGDLALLIDPGLPGQVLDARLRERTGRGLDSITHVFMTSFQADTTRGLEALTHATWWIAERERETVGVALATRLKAGVGLEDGHNAGYDAGHDTETLERLVAILHRCQPAPDSLADKVDLFPLPGVSAGTTGVLLAGRETTLICGDAIATIDHLEAGRVLPTCEDQDAARESFQEAIEIADILVLGRDNLVVNPTRRPF
jgi:glyoxylase-like metal-dependent hydrolase (beta-lactamase superfamily II)